jgi:hypothetical protein
MEAEYLGLIEKLREARESGPTSGQDVGADSRD